MIEDWMSSQWQLITSSMRIYFRRKPHHLALAQENIRRAVKWYSDFQYKYDFIQSYIDSFHLCLFNFPLIYQFHSIMTTLVRTTCWNPAELIIWKSFHHHFKRIWWGLLIEIEMQLFLLSLLKYSETSSQMITFNHFRCHLSYFSSYK